MSSSLDTVAVERSLSRALPLSSVAAPFRNLGCNTASAAATASKPSGYSGFAPNAVSGKPRLPTGVTLEGPGGPKVTFPRCLLRVRRLCSLRHHTSTTVPQNCRISDAGGRSISLPVRSDLRAS